MTKRQLEAIQQRLQFVDDPEQRHKLLRSVRRAEQARRDEQVLAAARRVEYVERRHQVFKFLIDGVAELRPDIQDLENVPMGQLIAMVEPTHPELAQKLRDYIGPAVAVPSGTT
jgi:hypothetical protein